MEERARKSPKLRISNLFKEYDGVPILERISLSIEDGTFCTIVGASGCGKSTFLRLLLSQEIPTRGHILLDGVPLPSEPTPDRGIVFKNIRFSRISPLRIILSLQMSSAAPL